MIARVRKEVGRWLERGGWVGGWVKDVPSDGHRPSPLGACVFQEFFYSCGPSCVSSCCFLFCFGWVGGWVGGWVEWVEEEQSV